MKLIDATRLKVGRLASKVAEGALEGEEYKIVNSEKAVITGNKDETLEKYEKRRKVGSRYKGPFYPRRADKLLRRSIRGMLPYKKKKGKKALKRIKTYVGIPEDLENQDFSTVKGAEIGDIERKKYIALEKISKELGAKDE